jgi:hypothetical protein
MIIKFPRLKVSKIVIGEFTEAAGQYSIFALPGILVYIEGKEIIREQDSLALNVRKSYTEIL